MLDHVLHRRLVRREDLLRGPELYNRTRSSRSIPLGLLKRGRLLELPLYYLLRQSDLAREGFENSGSHQFADHIYCNVPSGSNRFGHWLDARLLALPAVRSFRNRFIAARDELAAFLRQHNGEALHVLSVPCGIPRELAEAAALARKQWCDLGRVVFHGLDLDSAVLVKATRFSLERGLDNFQPHFGDALTRSSYPAAIHFATSTGLAEFLNDDALLQLYSCIYEALVPGGIFVSSGMQRRRLSEYLLKLAELHVHYRNAETLERLARAAGFQEVAVRYDEMGIQCILVARK
ncbi:MAG TPA: class I SAM-dependent methyltransferase family protein [Candidatus Angelobacter sp.]|jgi:SAM-dependent methyltransferase|nr:class I SAM-dependent methyltransferase family protein [Candidatus Angelobacter sp.]